ncbi:hypothetical protein [Glutamicibacter nicotianae]|uniref:Uncharacterized protein n=1 Tax=Glutamicibacter nicotianae TaxID=37929 RepID=A0ABQ0RLR3_GLUNI|nr:hypothetical protein [Glutamicibacter nicotianae]GEC12752.1 hypothetical protein ANI01nite_19550 [Glutamicibacter nicotianae]
MVNNHAPTCTARNNVSADLSDDTVEHRPDSTTDTHREVDTRVWPPATASTATEQQAEVLAKKHRIAKDSPEIQALLKDHPSPAMQAAADALNLDAHDWVQVEPSADDRASKKYFVGKDVLHPGSGEQKPNPTNSGVSSQWIEAEG